MVVNDVHNLRLDVDVKRKNGMDMFLTTDAMDATAHEDKLSQTCELSGAATSRTDEIVHGHCVSPLDQCSGDLVTDVKEFRGTTPTCTRAVRRGVERRHGRLVSLTRRALPGLAAVSRRVVGSAVRRTSDSAGETRGDEKFFENRSVEKGGECHGLICVSTGRDGQGVNTCSKSILTQH